MKTILATLTCFAIAAGYAKADTKFFSEIISDAAKIERDANGIRTILDKKNFNVDEVRKGTDLLGADIAALKSNVDGFAGSHTGMTDAQKKDWELVKTKAQLLVVFHENKSELLKSGDPQKNRTMLRAQAKGIADRAARLQQTATRLK